jgi:hypothetical protein
MRYVAIHAEDDYAWGQRPLIPSLSAHDLKTVYTGLLDARGRKLLRVPEPCGFHTPKARG